MFGNLFWLLGVAGLIAQILCCVYGRKRIIQLLPMGIMGLILLGTVVLGSTIGGLGFFAAVALAWNEVKILMLMVLGAGLYQLVMFTKK